MSSKHKEPHSFILLFICALISREWIVNSKRQEYRAIWEKRRRLAGKEKEEFERCVESVVEKDVIRTDRGNPFYAGHGNPHVDTMK